MQAHSQLRFFGIIGLFGAGLFILSSLFHPTTFNPWNSLGTYQKVSEHHFWITDHILILVGLTCWLLALIVGNHFLTRHHSFSQIGACIMVIALSIWVIVLILEIGIVPTLTKAISHPLEKLMADWFIVFGFSLFAGYIAFIFIWLGVLTYSIAIDSKGLPLWFKYFGITSGITGVIGIIIGLLMIDFVPFILAFTSGPPFIWTILFIWFMVKKNEG
ncbi:hypothetical protein [Aquibacillus salsiterrae]|uniref:DUF4386 family protein n=1 Tax=Aquibacillus salsiterrae TaxID=2950439 RepID=A0A9X4AEW8_9BACI|nr:hypothetical protein [Aquibacillus salsiterrae]MDC3417382.1 hypothetical protein [Aquibacillus salsiterrae]